MEVVRVITLEANQVRKDRAPKGAIELKVKIVDNLVYLEEIAEIVEEIKNVIYKDFSGPSYESTEIRVIKPQSASSWHNPSSFKPKIPL